VLEAGKGGLELWRDLQLIEGEGGFDRQPVLRGSEGNGVGL